MLPNKLTRLPTVAGVCILDNPFAIDGTYDYWIPEELAEDMRPGVFVTVPFGIRNVRRLGLVREVRMSSDYKDLKAVDAICPPERVSLDEELLGLCDFMRLRTICSTGDAVRAMVPASALSRLVALYSPTEKQHSTGESDEMFSSDSFVYSAVCEYGEDMPITLLRQKFGRMAEHHLRRLVRQGFLRRRVILKDRTAEQTVKLWFARYTEADLWYLIDGESIDGVRLTSQKQKDAVRAVIESDEPLTTAELCARADVTESPLKTLCAKGILEVREKRIDRNPYACLPFTGRTELSLNDEQAAALDTLTALATSGEARAALLHGVTGSGKTVVMTALMDRLLDEGRGVILLLPEIALTPQTVSIFCARYGDRVAVIHSALSAGERYDAYCRIRSGEADVVIGTRSAVFSPVKNLGAIIIDEEQEHTYKSDQNPKYHARDIARYRCAKSNALMLLASATPSIESYRKAKEGIYTLIRLTKRYGGAVLPRVVVADMRREAQGGNISPLGNRLLAELSRVTGEGEQAVLFLNRRGYNHFVSCRSCGEAIVCPSCSVAMTYHTRKRTYESGDMFCHWCGKKMPLPRTCPSCSSEHLARMGFGTQRVEEELAALLPEKTVLRMDTDTTASKFAYEKMLGDFREHRADVLLGTQMVTKGHDFPDVTLVGVLLADTSLYLDDYRASERTFSMLTQVVGRAGRRTGSEGLAVIQTNNPDHEVIRLACAQDYEGFYEREIRLRKLLTFPPFCDIALITVSGTLEGSVMEGGMAVGKEITKMTEDEYKDVELVMFGPFEAPIYRVNDRYRIRTVLKCRQTKRTLSMLAELTCRFWRRFGKRINLSIDFNPSNL